MTPKSGWAFTRPCSRARRNVIAIPIAAGVLVPWGIDLPMAVGAIAMSLSTIIVAANAQLLRRLKLRADDPPAAPPASSRHARPHPA